MYKEGKSHMSRGWTEGRAPKDIQWLHAESRTPRERSAAGKEWKGAEDCPEKKQGNKSVSQATRVVVRS